MALKFIRTDSNRFSKLGKKRKRLQVWRNARGVHSKIRRKRRGYPRMPTVGYKSEKSTAHKLQGLSPVIIQNPSQVTGIDPKTSIGIIAGRVGARKRLEIIKTASEHKIKLLNVHGGGKQ